jgi:hypothetical protein
MRNESVLGHSGLAIAEGLLVALLAAIVLIGLAPLSAPAADLAGADDALAGKSRYSGYLVATPQTLRAGDVFDVRGCGYDPALGNVKLGFTGGSWGAALDAWGCFTVTDIPALSGDTLPPGTYEVSAYQLSRKRWIETGDTTITVVP